MRHEVKFGVVLAPVAQKYHGIGIRMESIIIIRTDRVDIDMEDIRILLEGSKYRLIGHFCKGMDDEIEKLEEVYG